MSSFNDFALDARILATLNSIGYNTPTPVQADTIPMGLNGDDIIASAQTGTGKTGAFLLPVLHSLANSKSLGRGRPRALILAPTRELALQISTEAVKFSKRLPGIRTACVYGGVPYPVQRKQLDRGCDLLVATPGRLMDLVEQKIIDLSGVEILVLDEADRMLDMGFIGPVEAIAEMASADRQTLLFSATMDKRIMKLSANLQINPQRVEVKPDLTGGGKIDQRLYMVEGIRHKMQLLEHLLKEEEFDQAIVFTSTKRQADELSDALYEQGHKTAALHGDINQRRRTRTIKMLRDGKVRILIATDVAARGIDVSTLSHVFNFDLPMQAEDFVHRTGRTGRNGASGIAISFCADRDRSKLREIERLTGKEIEVHVVEGMEPRLPKKSPGNAKRKGPAGAGPKRFGNGPRGGFGARGERSQSDRGPRSGGFGSRDDRPQSDRGPRHGGFGSRDDRAQSDRGPRHGGFGSRDDRPQSERGPRSGGFGSRGDRPQSDRGPRSGGFGARGDRNNAGGGRRFGGGPRKRNGGRAFAGKVSKG